MDIKEGDSYLVKVMASDIGGVGVWWVSGRVRYEGQTPYLETGDNSVVGKYDRIVSDGDIPVVGGRVKVPPGHWSAIDLRYGGVRHADCGGVTLDGTLICAYAADLETLVFPDRLASCTLYGTKVVLGPQAFTVTANFFCSDSNFGDYRHVPNVERHIGIMSEAATVDKAMASISLLNLFRSGCMVVKVAASETLAGQGTVIQRPKGGIFRQKLALLSTPYKKGAWL